MHGFRKSFFCFFAFFRPRNRFFVQAASKKAKCGSSTAPGRSARGLPDSPTGVECAKMLQVSTLLPPAPSLPTPSSAGASRGGGHAGQLPLNGVAPTAKLTTGGVWDAGGQQLHTQPRTTWVALYASKSRKTPLLFHMLFWTVTTTYYPI